MYTRQLDEVAHVDGGVLARQLHADGALRRGDDGDLVAGRLVFRSVLRHGSAPFRLLAIMRPRETGRKYRIQG